MSAKIVKKSLIASILSVGLLISFSSGVFAEPVNPIATSAFNYELDPVKKSFDENGINKETQVKLIEKIEKGELLDSLNPKMTSKGITLTTYDNKAVTNLTDTQSLKAYTSKTVFPDGSFITVKVAPLPTNGITPRDVTPGPGTVCGSGYCNIYDAKVSYDTGVVYAEFLADYTIVHGGYDSISKVYQPKVKVFTGSYSDLKDPVIIRGTETYYQSAKATMTWKYSAGPLGTSQQYLVLDVQDDTASASSN